jgi:hypothetical protein
LEWSEQELLVIDRACVTADRVEVLRGFFDEERGGDARPSVLVKLSAEIRACDKQVVDLVRESGYWAGEVGSSFAGGRSTGGRRTVPDGPRGVSGSPP